MSLVLNLRYIRRWRRSLQQFGIARRKGRAFPLIGRHSRKKVDRVVWCLARSHSLLARLEEMGAPKERLRLNRTSIPLDHYPEVTRTPPADGRWRLVQACRLIEKKGLRTALEAFARLRRLYPAARFTIAGEGPLRAKLEGWIGELGLTGAVDLRGFLSQADLNALYAESHLFLHPSEVTADQNQEGVPNSMLEAMATGLPVVATLHGGIPEAVTQERNGLLVPERDVEALFGALQRITSTPGMLEAYGREAAQAVREEFSQERALAKLEGYYDEAREIFAGKGRAA